MRHLLDIAFTEESQGREEVLNVIKAIDSVHRPHTLPPLPIVRLPILFSNLPEPIQGQLLYAKYENLECEIHVDTHNAHIALTVAHELGHFLDILWLGHRSPASVSDARFGNWRKAVSSTLACDQLSALISRKHVTILYQDQEPQTFEPDDEMREYGRYLLQWKELWARSYAQYIATVSGNTILSAQLGRELKSDFCTVFPRQWNEEDFAPVKEAMSQLFET